MTAPCVVCGGQFPVETMDIVGTGNRCAPCGARAGQGQSVHWSPASRAAHARGVRLYLRFGIFLCLISLVIGVIVFAIASTQDSHNASIRPGRGWLMLGGPFLAFGIASLIRGFIERSRMR